MSIDPMNARTQLIAGINAMYFEWDMPKARECILRAIELNPNMFEAHFQLGWYYMFTQQKDMIAGAMNNAYRLDPIGGETVPGLGEAYFFSGNPEMAEKYCDEGIRNNPTSMYANSMKALVTGALEGWDKGLATLETWCPPEGIPLFDGLKGFAEGMAGQTEKALERINQMLEMRAIENGPPMSALLAIMYLGIGDKEKFYFYFEEAMQIKSVTILHFYDSPLLKAVNGEERVKALRRKYNLPE